MQNHAISAPAVRPGFRLVQALVGRSQDNAARVWIECPTWCDQDHATDRQVAVEDIWHSGPFVDIELPHRDGSELLAYFRLGLDPYSSDPAKRRPFVYGEDGFTADGRYMDAEHLDEMCDKAEESIKALRAMAKACRALTDSDVDMDEALRRIRSGGAA